MTSALGVFSLALVVFALAAALSRSRPVPVAAVSGAAVVLSSPGGDAGLRPAPHRGLEQVGRAGAAVLVLGTILLCLAVVARGVAAGRAPWGNMYEFGLTGSAAVAVAFLAYGRGRPTGVLAPWTVTLVLVLLGVSVTSLYTPVDDLVPVLNSRWLVVHVAAAITAGALFTVGALATIAHLVRQRGGGDEDDHFSDLAHTVHLVAFPVWTFAVIAGAVWAENAWGRYWGWDPKETWAFITWVFYAAHLHALSTVGWRRRAGWLALAGFLAFVFNFFGVNLWIPGLHSYAGV
ncbi:cytochrome c biogenesis protein CcsA [Nocardioides alpinus]|uniref:cytochrome c biogenesis protein CcsA n=1 Tax=Nocardioides alpinus TaxID=748909 RepID=UPI001E4AB94E|nr:cytochrome c biogenesis protein CcsA [Nocardioides alpinus]